jgi:hypothetical protein
MVTADWVSAWATVALAGGAGVTVAYARAAFKKQTEEVGALQREAIEQQRAIEQQGKLLTVQSDQLEVQRKQLAAQQEVNEEQLRVLKLQADEFQAVFEQREREATERHRAQAVRVFMWEERFEHDPRVDQDMTDTGINAPYTVKAWVKNQSDLPVYEVITSWHLDSLPKGTTPVTPALMPGLDTYCFMQLPDDFPENGDKTNLGAVAFFRDAAGTYWRSRPDGKLDEIPPENLPPRSW